MKNKYKAFFSNKYLLAFSTLVTGSALAQIITVLVSPITTRLFSPEQFGNYTLLATVVSLFGPIICLKYDMSIVIAKTETEVKTIMKSCMLICTALSIFFGTIYGWIFFNKSGHFLWLYISASIILLLTYGLNNILLAHNNRNSLYKLISSVTILKSIVNNCIMVLGGVFFPSTITLIFSNIISSISGVGRQSKEIRGSLKEYKNISFSSIKDTLKKHSNQPKYNATSALLSTTTYSSINLFIKFAYSSESLGLYSLSYRILGIPFSIISANIARIFFNSAVQEVRDTGFFSKTFKKTLLILVCTVIPIIIFLSLFAPWGFSIIFGKNWGDAGLYVRILAPMFAIRLITESLTTSFIVSSRQHKELLFHLALFGGEILLFVISLTTHMKIEYFLFLISVLYMFIHSIMLFVMYKYSKENVEYVES